MRFRSILVYVLLTAWTATPALACLPTRNMSKAEMACCYLWIRLFLSPYALGLY